MSISDLNINNVELQEILEELQHKAVNGGGDAGGGGGNIETFTGRISIGGHFLQLLMIRTQVFTIQMEVVIYKILL